MERQVLKMGGRLHPLRRKSLRHPGLPSKYTACASRSSFQRGDFVLMIGADQRTVLLPALWVCREPLQSPPGDPIY